MSFGNDLFPLPIIEFEGEENFESSFNGSAGCW